MSNDIRPLNHLNIITKQFPIAWKMVEAALIDKGRELPNWPKWCFLPVALWEELCCYGRETISTRYSLGDVYSLAAIGTWRYTQSIYRFDADFRQCLVNSKLHGHIPVDALLRLPEFCIYLDTPGMQFGPFALHGCWVHLDSILGTNEIKMHLLLDLEWFGLMPFILSIGDWPLLDAVRNALEDIDRKTSDKWADSLFQVASLSDDFTRDITPLMSMILYLCSDEPEVVDRKSPGTPAKRPGLVKTRHGNRLFPPDRVRIWEIGNEIGRRLRTARSNYSGETHSHAVHLRCGHWHTFLTGPRNQVRGKRVKWLPPMMVGMADNYHDDFRGTQQSNKASKRAKRHS
ncbi:AcrVA2 family anti-CRISPR protein [Geobacter sulfurreducens]|uniref:AcrVA2 family anti-CRISPR protein n=1 Tax=Geobacter sulfurreducens TaxID=35554 RepID=UPI000DBB614B|nr:hypothetical protein [Geobacter sulfurreducens]BBA70632.1 hypothetical protein YM18_2113 [Geobacter sulfurreducens]